MSTLATHPLVVALAWGLLHPFPHVTPTPAPSAAPPVMEAAIGVVLLAGLVAAAAWYLAVER